MWGGRWSGRCWRGRPRPGRAEGASGFKSGEHGLQLQDGAPNLRLGWGCNRMATSLASSCEHLYNDDKPKLRSADRQKLLFDAQQAIQDSSLQYLSREMP